MVTRRECSKYPPLLPPQPPDGGVRGSEYEVRSPERYALAPGGPAAPSGAQSTPCSWAISVRHATLSSGVGASMLSHLPQHQASSQHT